MLQARCSPRRASSALALAVYALVLLAGPTHHHGILGSGHSGTHCVVCAAVGAHSSPAVSPVALLQDGTRAGAPVELGTTAEGGLCPPATGDRAPPAR